MTYIDNYELSPKTKQAFTKIVEGLISSTKRKKVIPTTYRFWLHTNEPNIVQELTEKGYIKFAFIEGNQRIYAHEVDKESLTKALGWDKN